jgi:hypothetical protein
MYSHSVLKKEQIFFCGLIINIQSLSVPAEPAGGQLHQASLTVFVLNGNFAIDSAQEEKEKCTET